MITSEYNNETDELRVHLLMNGQLVKTYDNIQVTGFTVL